MSLSKSRAQLRPAPSEEQLARRSKKRRRAPADGSQVAAFASTLAKDDLDEWGFDERVTGALLGTMGIERFFPLQREALDSLLKAPSSDACISARTGASGAKACL